MMTTSVPASLADRLARAQQEVAGEVHAVDAQPGPARDLEVDDGEADRDAGAAIEDFVEEAVARIVVALAVAGEALLVVEVFVERADRVLLRARRPTVRRARPPPRPCDRASPGRAAGRATGIRPGRSRAPPAPGRRPARSWRAPVRRRPARCASGDGGRTARVIVARPGSGARFMACRARARSRSRLARSRSFSRPLEPAPA